MPFISWVSDALVDEAATDVAVDAGASTALGDATATGLLAGDGSAVVAPQVAPQASAMMNAPVAGAGPAAGAGITSATPNALATGAAAPAVDASSLATRSIAPTIDATAGQGITSTGAFPTEASYTPAPGGQPYAPIGGGATAAEGGGGLMDGLSKAADWMQSHSIATGLGVFAGAKLLGMMNPQQYTPPAQPKSTTNYNMSNFQPSRMTNYPSVMQQPGYPTYMNPPGFSGYAQGGGIKSYDMGGSVSANPAQNFPQSQIGNMSSAQYANAMQMPTGAMAVNTNPTPMNPMTGGIMNARPMKSGGIAHYCSGGQTTAQQMQNYANMMGGGSGCFTPQCKCMAVYQKLMTPAAAPAAAPSGRTSSGIFSDPDQDTRYKDALQAAQIRMSKINSAANMPAGYGAQLPKTAEQLGKINMNPACAPKQTAPQYQSPEYAASGGIMGYNLGGYAHGEVPRLLKGPGDGMSDDIPATIADRQEARLADGEFVVPADVVSHLGNGSTDAGAKKLHDMMTKVREARTGNPKQGKQIKAEKFIPS
jgi:hypothetical protein